MRLFRLSFIFAASFQLCAQLPLATLHSIFPPGAQAGSTNEVTVSGSELDDPAGLWFSNPRITAVPKPGAPSQFQVILPSALPEQIVDVRFVGKFGISNPRAFAIGTLPELTAGPTNTSAASAIDLPLDKTINGRAIANAFAWFRFTAQKDQRLIVRVQARALDSRLVPNIFVLDSAERELAVARRREWLDFTPPAEGQYLIKLADQIFRGGDDYSFRLTLSTGPHLEFAHPIVLRAGETNRVALYGRNLPGGRPAAFLGPDGRPLEQLEWQIPAPICPSLDLPLLTSEAALRDRAFTWRLASSNPILFLLTTNPVVIAGASQLVRAQPPFELCGFFPARGEITGATFPAEKSQALWLEIFSDRLGFPADSHVLVRQSSNNQERGELEDQNGPADRELRTTTRDGALLFTVPESADYDVLVRDLFNLGKTRPRYPYALGVRPAPRDFQIVASPMPAPRVGDDRKVHVLPLTLRRDETIALKAIVRRHGFDADIEILAADLPGGLAVAPTRIAAGQTTGTILITAASNAVTVTNISVTAKSLDTNAGTATSSLSSVLWPVADFNNEHATARLNRDHVISVITAELAPITISADSTNSFTVQAEAKLALPLIVVRRGEFQAAFNVKPAGHPALAQVAEIALPEKATNLTAEIDLAKAKLPAGTHTLWLEGTIAGKYQPDSPAAAEKPKPRDVKLMVYSRPFAVTVLPKPEEKK